MINNTSSEITLQWKTDKNLSCCNYREYSIGSILSQMLEIVRVLDIFSQTGLCCLDIKGLCIYDNSIKITGEKLSGKMNSAPIFIAPEIKRGCCKDTSLALVYSVGAILYTKLFNREPTISLAELYSVIDYSGSALCSNLDEKSITMLDRFIHHTFTMSRYARWDLKRTLLELEHMVNTIV